MEKTPLNVPKALELCSHLLSGTDLLFESCWNSGASVSVIEQLFIAGDAFEKALNLLMFDYSFRKL